MQQLLLKSPRLIRKQRLKIRGCAGSLKVRVIHVGHALDLPDLYDVISTDGTDSEGIGHWGLMGSGGHNQQTSPAHLSAWSKDYLGWVNVTTLSSSQAGLSLPPIKEDGQVFRVDLPSSNEHFLLSHRTASGSDQHLHGSGLLIWHIDRDLAGGLSEVGNRVNTDAHRKGVDQLLFSSRGDRHTSSPVFASRARR